MSHSNDGENPSRAERYALRVLRLKPGQCVQVLALSPYYDGLWVHWVKGRGGVYCPPDGDCPPAIHKEPVIYRGYFAGELWVDEHSMWFPSVIEITSGAELDMRGRYQRGQVWELEKPRVEKPRRPPLLARYVRSENPDHVRPHFDLLPALALMYNLANVQLGRGNPLPGRMFVAPHEGEKPRPARNADTASTSEIRDTFKRLTETMASRNGKGGNP